MNTNECLLPSTAFPLAVFLTTTAIAAAAGAAVAYNDAGRNGKREADNHCVEAISAWVTLG